MKRAASMWALCAAVITVCVTGVPVPQARAQATAEASYPYKRVWPAAVRFLRVDEGFPIIEKDAEAGYVLFAVEEEGKTFRGSLQIIRLKDREGRHAVRLELEIEDRPSYMEQMIVERLERKLRDELGDPPPPPPPAPAPEKPSETR
jgi:hypothetical protein